MATDRRRNSNGENWRWVRDAMIMTMRRSNGVAMGIGIRMVFRRARGFSGCLEWHLKVVFREGLNIFEIFVGLILSRCNPVRTALIQEP